MSNRPAMLFILQGLFDVVILASLGPTERLPLSGKSSHHFLRDYLPDNFIIAKFEHQNTYTAFTLSFFRRGRGEVLAHQVMLYNDIEIYQPHEVSSTTLAYEGGNKQSILVVYDIGKAGPLEAAEKEQLMKILAALKLSIDDISLTNAQELYTYGFAGWVNNGPPFNKMIAFGASAMNMGLTIRLKRYFISTFLAKDLLFIDSLAAVMADPKLKAQLWTVLQVMFGIKK